MSVSWPHDCFVNYMSPLPGLVQVFFIYLFNSVYCWPRMKNEKNFALSWISVYISIYSMGYVFWIYIPTFCKGNVMHEIAHLKVINLSINKIYF